MTPEDCLAAIDRALKQARARELTDVTVRLDWVYYRELVKLKGIEPAESDRELWEGQTGLTPDCTLPAQTVRKVPIHVNKPPEYASVVRGNDRGTITAFVVRA